MARLFDKYGIFMALHFPTSAVILWQGERDTMKPEYLGDGLYAVFENMQIKLMANSDTEPTGVVYLEWPTVYEALQEFVRRSLKEVGVDENDSSR